MNWIRVSQYSVVNVGCNFYGIFSVATFCGAACWENAASKLSLGWGG